MHRARKRFGQHFLTDPGVIDAMWISQPPSCSRADVPPQKISASSGWAIRASARMGDRLARRGGDLDHRFEPVLQDPAGNFDVGGHDLQTSGF